MLAGEIKKKKIIEQKRQGPSYDDSTNLKKTTRKLSKTDQISAEDLGVLFFVFWAQH